MPLLRRARVAAIIFVVAWFFVPTLRSAFPAWIPFAALVALELNFLVDGVRGRRAPRTRRGRPPLETDVEDLGGREWLEPVVVDVDGRDVWLPAQVDEEGERPAPAPLPERRGWRALEGLGALGALALVLVVLLGGRGWDALEPEERRRTETRLSSEAARIAGHVVRVRCDAEREEVGVVQHADGVAEVGGRNAFLTPEICFRLQRVVEGGEAEPFAETARAIAVLAHEAWHLHGVRDEGVANCYAFQSGVELGRRLGLPRATAARMMRQQLAENAIVARSAPQYLVPAACRNGGRLDLAPADDRFP